MQRCASGMNKPEGKSQSYDQVIGNVCRKLNSLTLMTSKDCDA